eukprot:GGOE01005897.1.p1 GENE.GGOE01005897.1~~GGOE01005897.1.p1  ORF type:complete len:1434 (+),score=386.07 GGOE01005897.1:581-4303(+)
MSPKEEQMLRGFEEYWSLMLNKYGSMPSVSITLRNARATVMALKPRDRQRLDNILTPIKRVFQRCAQKEVMEELPVLSGLNMEFKPGTMTLLLGEPGSGKSTLLRMIAGRLLKDQQWISDGVAINGVPVDSSANNPAQWVALVDEVDVHIPTMSVQDTLRFAYKCRYDHAEATHVETILSILGLSHVAKTVVGGEGVRGCSGGERRRVTVGEQWAANTRALLADRLTDGLDSQATLDLVRALRVWSYTTNATVILSLLQPPPEVIKYFDNVCVLWRKQGKFLFQPMSKAAAILHSMNLDAVQGNDEFSMAAHSKTLDPIEPLTKGRKSCYMRSFPVQVLILIKRQFQLEFFNKGLLISRIALSLANGLLTASIFKRTDNSNEALFVRSSMLFHTCMTVVISLVSHIGIFGADLPVFHKQREGFFFRSSAYWVAHNFFYILFWGFLETLLLSITTYWLSGLQKSGTKFMIFWMAVYLLSLISSIIFKILATICSSVSIAQIWAGFIQIIFFVYSGFLQPWNSMPSGWVWAMYISPQSYTFMILMLNEFIDQPYYCTADEFILYESSCPHVSGNTWLNDVFGITPKASNIGWFFLCLVGWLVLYFFLGMLALHFYHPKKRIMHRRMQFEMDSFQGLLIPKPVTLSWRNLCYTVKMKKEESKQLLHNVVGIVKPGTMSALMGPSGAGKTTLLDVLAGWKTKGTIEGDILINGRPKEQRSFSQISGYVEQFNCQLELLTVVESLEFSARLRLGRNISKEDRKSFVEAVVQMLQLTEVAHEQVRNILMDQKKRTSVGVEVVSLPSILFLDEPTTGLDSTGAFILVKALTRLRDEIKVAIVCTIHQPSKALFWMFDRLVLMAKGGHMAYSGALGMQSETLQRYLEGIPEVDRMRGGENPAVWMLQQIGGGVSPNPERTEAVKAHWPVGSAAAQLEAELGAILPGESVDTGVRYGEGWFTQLWVLVHRAATIFWRAPNYNLMRTFLLVVICILLGTVYWNLQFDQSGVWPRMALFYTLSLYLGLTFALSATSVMLPMRAAYYKERASGAYSSWVYGVSYFIVELPYVFFNSVLALIIVWTLSRLSHNVTLGYHIRTYFAVFAPLWSFLYMCNIMGHAVAAISPTLEVANAIASGMASWMSSFSGFYLPRPDIPGGYLWLYWLDPLRYAYEAIILAEFDGMAISCNGYTTLNGTNQPFCRYKSGSDVIQQWGMLQWGYGMDIGVVWAYLICFGILAFIGLKWLKFGTR